MESKKEGGGIEIQSRQDFKPPTKRPGGRPSGASIQLNAKRGKKKKKKREGRILGIRKNFFVCRDIEKPSQAQKGGRSSSRGKNSFTLFFGKGRGREKKKHVLALFGKGNLALEEKRCTQAPRRREGSKVYCQKGSPRDQGLLTS